MRSPENHGRNQKTHHSSAADTFNPILNQAPEKELFRKRSEKENARENRHRVVKLSYREAVMNEIDPESQGNRDDCENTEVNQPCNNECPLILKAIPYIRSLVPDSK